MKHMHYDQMARSISCGPATAYRNYLHRWNTREGVPVVIKPDALSFK